MKMFFWDLHVVKLEDAIIIKTDKSVIKRHKFTSEVDLMPNKTWQKA